MEQPLKLELGFVQRRLPILVAAGAFILYLVTLNHSATFGGLVNLAKVVGWDWHPNILSPLHVLVTLPVRMMPAGVQLLALNAIAALCAAGSVGMLARCVSLLPFDRTRDQRQLERSEHSLLSVKLAWVPPVLAALVAGLQISFWENAVVGTGEALDLLIFAWLIQTLLIYRLDQKESRLSWFALVYGLSITNNYAMIGFFPFFLGAIVWIRGADFFNLRFILRILGFGLAGLLLYFVLPAFEARGDGTGYTWWELVRLHWASQRDSLIGFPRIIAVLLSFTSILPVIFMGIRWPAQFGEVSPLGNVLTNLMTHLIHGVFLVACAYVAFDQFFSPRNLGGSLAAFLPFYFLGALAVGYCSGYFLLLGTSSGQKGPQWQKPSPLRDLTFKVVAWAVLLALVVLPTLLLVQNLPQMLANTGSALSRLSTISAQSLPKTGAVVLSDETFRLFALENELRQSGGREKFILLDSRSLESGGYHLYLQHRYPNLWPKLADNIEVKDRIPQGALVQMMVGLAAKMPIYYLHPSFGYYFETFETHPKGMVYELRQSPRTSISGSPLSPEERATGDQFWRDLWARELQTLSQRIPPAEFPSGAKLRVRPETLEMYVGRSYAQALNHYGVAVQRAGDVAGAAEYYDKAIKLDPYNASALVNLQYNKQLRAGKVDGYKPGDDVTKRFARGGGSWESVLSTYGPLEEPNICFAAARAFDAGGNPRQAAQYLERAIHYNSNDLAGKLILAQLALRASLPVVTLRMVNELRATPGLTERQQSELSTAEGWAYALNKDYSRAEQILRAEIARRPADPEPWSHLFDMYRSAGRSTNALMLRDEQLKVQPRNVQALVDAAVLKRSFGATNEAIIYLDRALEVNPNDEYARFNRAVFQAALGRFDVAKADFEKLLSARVISQTSVEFGLADIYYQTKRSTEARRLYKRLEKMLPEGSPEQRLAADRLKQLK